MKNKFDAPQFEVKEFNVEDIVTASTHGLNGYEQGDGDKTSYDQLIG